MNMNNYLSKSLVSALLTFCIGWSNCATAQWVKANTGLPINEVNSFATVGTTLFASTGNSSGNGMGIYKSTDHGGNWTAANTGLVSLDTRKIIAVGDTLFVAIAGVNITDGGIYKSGDGGNNWIEANNGLPRKVAYAIAYHQGTLYTSISASGGVKAVYISTENGNSWTITNSSVLNNNTPKSIVGIGGNILVASDGGVKGVYLSTDNGSNWTATSITQETDALAVVGNTVFAATGTGVKKSTDNGATWSATTNTSGIIDNATALAVVGQCLIVATPGGRVFSSNDEGTTWNDVSTGASLSLGAEALWMDATYMYAGMFGTSTAVWKRPLSEFACMNTGLEMPEHDFQATVYPNPSNGHFQLHMNPLAQTRVEIYNSTGAIVYSTTTTEQQSEIDLSQVAKGIYLLKLTNWATTYNTRLVVH